MELGKCSADMVAPMVTVSSVVCWKILINNEGALKKEFYKALPRTTLGTWELGLARTGTNTGKAV